ncbi:restriction endonuclease subunit S [bacterium]|nr:restriction endonuclease subunit S [bacterium]
MGVSSIRWDETVYWKRRNGDGLDEFSLEAGDLVLGMDRPRISGGIRVARVSLEDTPSLLLQRVVKLRPREELYSDYLEYCFLEEFFVPHFEPETTGVSVPHISPGQIKDFSIPIPPKVEQAEIVEHIWEQTSRFDNLLSRAEAQITLLQERRTALISAAVTGKIDVRDWESPKDQEVSA